MDHQLALLLPCQHGVVRKGLWKDHELSAASAQGKPAATMTAHKLVQDMKPEFDEFTVRAVSSRREQPEWKAVPVLAEAGGQVTYPRHMVQVNAVVWHAKQLMHHGLVCPLQ